MPVLALAVLPATAAATGEIGNDISYPQCAGLSNLQAAQNFAVIGLNGGKATSLNSCLNQELGWADTVPATNTFNQNSVQLYVNTGNPGDVLRQAKVTDWPTNNIDPATGQSIVDPYGTCSGKNNNDAACAWQYGFDRARDDQNALLTAQMAGYTVTSPVKWWLDVETVNSWSRTKSNNQADLEGMVAALTNGKNGDSVGLYSTASMWKSIVGTTSPTFKGNPDSLQGLQSWIPGASSSNASTFCSTAYDLTAGNGGVSMSQYVNNNLDYDYNCL